MYIFFLNLFKNNWKSYEILWKSNVERNQKVIENKTSDEATNENQIIRARIDQRIF